MPSKVRALRRGGALSRSEKKETGPLQIVVVGFDELKFEGDIIAELKRLRTLEIVRLVDMVIVAKSKGGELVPVKAGELSGDEAAQYGSIVGAFLELDGEEDDGDDSGGSAGDALGFVGSESTWSVPDVIPAGTMAVVVLLEHRWAIPVRDAVVKAGGKTLADAWLQPDDPIVQRIQP
jgi:hypothetical protein